MTKMLSHVILGLTAINHRYYRFFYRKRGIWFAIRVWVLHGLHHLCNGLSFATGAALFVAARYPGLQLPCALPIDSWSATLSRSASAARIPCPKCASQDAPERLY